MCIKTTPIAKEYLVEKGNIKSDYNTIYILYSNKYNVYRLIMLVFTQVGVRRIKTNKSQAIVVR